MSKRYELLRSTSPPQARATETDDSTGVVYVYLRYQDRVDVHKFSRVDIMGARSGEDLLSVSVPSYRVIAGACSCSGYQYRQTCRHAEKVRWLAEAFAEGWQGAAE